jgi:hypothetical protein
VKLPDVVELLMIAGSRTVAPATLEPAASTTPSIKFKANRFMVNLLFEFAAIAANEQRLFSTSFHLSVLSLHLLTLPEGSRVPHAPVNRDSRAGMLRWPVRR